MDKPSCLEHAGRVTYGLAHGTGSDGLVDIPFLLRNAVEEGGGLIDKIGSDSTGLGDTPLLSAVCSQGGRGELVDCCVPPSVGSVKRGLGRVP